MVLGDTCSRSCRFCSVKSGNVGAIPDPDEPERVAAAVKLLGLRYVVLTMVTRDDLNDGGANQVINTVSRLRAELPSLLIETLVSDFGGRASSVERVVVEARPDVYAHNVEVVPRLSPVMRDRRSSWNQSLATLTVAKRAGARVTKSSLMVGCGETDAEVEQAMVELRSTGVSLLTIGQYLRPSLTQAPVDRFVTPEQFVAYREIGLRLGFSEVASGPLIRSSFRAAESYHRAMGDSEAQHHELNWLAQGKTGQNGERRTTF
jgi:lipoyl synthase